jgi:Ca2+-binding EF-hand superfamily protein
MGQPPSRFDGGWKAYDLNGDGKVTRAEFSAVRNLCFVRVDGNGDGRLTRAEIQRLRESQPAAPGDPAAARPGRESGGDMSREEYDRAGDSLWQLLDTNGDGVIAGMELTALSAALSRDLCQPSGGPGAREQGRLGPPSGPGPDGRR